MINTAMTTRSRLRSQGDHFSQHAHNLHITFLYVISRPAAKENPPRRKQGWDRAHLDTATGGVPPSPAAASNEFFERAVATPLSRIVHVAAPEDGRTPGPLSQSDTGSSVKMRTPGF